ncbi:MAG: metallophosphoesterase family protein [Oscillospiraceae bacterium]|nr:metallophosphoesterase family protein [Oscillospiraceae bacterium]
MRKLTAIILAITMLLGSFAFSAQAAEPVVSRVVTTFYGPGAQGFHWYTDVKTESRVIVDGESYAGTSKSFDGAWSHSAVVSGLEPGTQYSYRIGDYEGTFKTDPGRGRPMNFIVGGDTQATGRDGFRLSANIFASAFETYPDAGFYSILGDLTQDSTGAQWDLFFEEFKSVNQSAPLVPVSGNHDGALKWGWFQNIFTLNEQCNYTNLSGVYYSFDYGDAHIAVINTNDWFHIGTAQRNWLINDMNGSNARWKIVMTHKPVYFHNEISPDCLGLRRILGPVCDMLGIDMVLSGHKHSYYRSAPLKNHGSADAARCDDSLFTDPDGTIYVMPGAAGGRGGSSPTFANIEINGDTLTYRAHIFDSETGQSTQRDEFVIEKTLPSKPVTESKLPTDPLLNLPGQLLNFFMNFMYLLIVEYIGHGLIIDAVKELF